MPNITVSQQEKEQQLTNNYTDRLISYVTRNTGFTKLITNLEAYISRAGGVLAYTIDEHNQPAQSIDENTDLAYLERLINKLGVSLDYFPSNYFANTSGSCVYGEWKWNDVVIIEHENITSRTYNIQFRALQGGNDATIKQFKSIKFQYSSTYDYMYYIDTNDTEYLYYFYHRTNQQGTWLGSQYIDFGSTPVCISVSTLYNFIQNNAKPLTTQLSESERQLKELYLLAIRGVVVNRTGNATKAQLYNALKTIYEDADIEIIDGGVNSTPGIMNVTVNIRGITTNLNKAVMSLYLKQDITGVQEQFNFDVSGVGVFSPVNAIEGASVDDIEELDTSSALQTYFTSNPTLPYGYDVNDPDKQYGMGGYMWAGATRNGTGDNNFTETTNIPDVPPTSSNPTYLGTAFWMIQLL